MEQKYDELYHYGVLGMKWGIHRKRKEDDESDSKTAGVKAVAKQVSIISKATTSGGRVSATSGTTKGVNAASKASSKQVSTISKATTSGGRVSATSGTTKGVRGAAKKTKKQVGAVGSASNVSSRIAKDATSTATVNEIQNKVENASKEVQSVKSSAKAASKIRNQINKYGNININKPSLAKTAYYGERFAKSVADGVKYTLKYFLSRKGG